MDDIRVTWEANELPEVRSVEQTTMTVIWTVLKVLLIGAAVLTAIPIVFTIIFWIVALVLGLLL